MTRPTFEQGIAKAEAIAAEHGIDPVELRWFASHHLSEQMRADYGPDHGMGISSSDTSHHLSGLGNYEPEVLVAEAERIAKRNTLVAQVARVSGKTPEEALANLRAFFAPVEA